MTNKVYEIGYIGGCQLGASFTTMPKVDMQKKHTLQR